jgi:hypothetical protein
MRCALMTISQCRPFPFWVPRSYHSRRFPFQYGYYLQQIDFSTQSPFAKNYGDYFAGRIVFPILNAAGQTIGIIGRRPDNRGVPWVKQQAGESAIFSILS